MAYIWTEDDYRAAGYRTIKLRLDAEAGEALDAMAKPRERCELISRLILAAYAKSTRPEKKVRRKG